jgi:hypothetical protein
MAAAPRPVSLLEQACRGSRRNPLQYQQSPVPGRPVVAVTTSAQGVCSSSAPTRRPRSASRPHQSSRQQRREHSSRRTSTAATELAVYDACHEIARVENLLGGGLLFALEVVVDGWPNRASPGAPPTSSSPIRGDTSEASMGCAREHMEFCRKSPKRSLSRHG